jgi:hypothetical protein
VAPAASRTRRRGGPRVVAGFLALGVLAGALLLGLDRLALRTAEQQVAARLQTSLGTPQRPGVTFDGVWFLPQVLRRDFTSVRVVANDLGTTNDAEEVAHVDLTLEHVRASEGYRRLLADSVTGTARLPYDRLGDLAGAPVSYAGDGRVQLSLQTTVLRIELQAHVTGIPQVKPSDQTVSLAQPRITVAGVKLGETTSQALIRALVKPAPMTGIPLDLRVESMTAREGHVDVSVGGQQVPLTG